MDVLRIILTSWLFAMPLVLAAQSSRPAVPLAGLRYVWIHPETTGDPRAARLGLPAYLEQLFAAQGWVVLNGLEDLLRADAREKASQTARCVLDIDYSGFGTQALLRCHDILGNELFTALDRAVALSMDGEVRAAVRNVAKAIQQERKQFDPRQTVDIVTRLPRVEMHPLTQSSLESMVADGKLVDPVEGLWAAATEGAYRVGIVRDGGDFLVVILESPQTYLWQSGMVRARLAPAADGRTFVAKWKTDDRREVPGVAVLDAGLLSLSVRVDGEEQRIPFVKLRSAGSVLGGAAGTTASSRSVTGTGFVCATGLIATNHHVIAGAKEVEFYLPVQNRSVKLELVVSDAVNDVALLRPAESGAELPPALLLVDSREIRLATEAFVIGFPLGDALGAGHKVTSGIVSGLEGLKGDPRELQLTAPIQPGSSGSPVLDGEGRVIAIVTSSLDSITALKGAGQVPQNVNFALKADYIALLLRHLTPSATAASRALSRPTPLTDMVEAARASVGQVRVVR